jgi:hypothetical protein
MMAACHPMGVLYWNSPVYEPVLGAVWVSAHKKLVEEDRSSV